jgi:hypothetical protein
VKEELLEDVSALGSRRAAGFEGLVAFDASVVVVTFSFAIAVSTSTSLSGSSDSEKSDLGGDGPAIGAVPATFTLSNALRVRRMGPLLCNGPPLASGSSLVLRGSVSAQFSQGMALFLSFSSYVLPKLESRLLSPFWSAATLGLVGGVSTAEGDVGDLIPAVWRPSLAPFSWSDEPDVVLLLRRAMPARPSEGLSEREPVLRRRALKPSSKQEVQPTGRPSVTINGVGPWVSQ